MNVFKCPKCGGTETKWLRGKEPDLIKCLNPNCGHVFRASDRREK